MVDKIFALVTDNVITQFPLTEDDISTIDIPTNNYLQCFYEELPDYDEELQYLIQVPILVYGQVIVKYKVKTYTLNEKLAACLAAYPTTQTDESGNPWINLLAVPQVTFLAVIKLVKDHVQKRLDTFAQTKGYDDCKSVVGYQFSTITAWAADAERAVALRDTSWTNLYTYLDNLQNGLALPIRNETDLETYLPELTWV